eukprot:1371752-Amphidinium_carterae.2
MLHCIVLHSRCFALHCIVRWRAVRASQFAWAGNIFTFLSLAVLKGSVCYNFSGRCCLCRVGAFCLCVSPFGVPCCLACSSRSRHVGGRDRRNDYSTTPFVHTYFLPLSPLARASLTGFVCMPDV